MIELSKISLRQYVELEDRTEYDFAMKYAFCFKEPIDEYKLGDLTELEFGTIKDLQYDIETGMTFDKLLNYIERLGKIKNIGTEPLDKVMRFSNYILESIKQIIEVENQILSHEPDIDEEEAGMDRFNGLGVYLQLRSIAITFHTTPNEVRKWKYADALTEMYTAKQLSDYERDLMKIKQRKNG